MDSRQIERNAFRILVGVDYSELGDLALARACELARAYERTELHVVHLEPVPLGDYGVSSAPPPVTGLDEASSRLHAHVEKVIATWCRAHATAAPFGRLTTHIRREGGAHAIAQLASDVEADLVVVGTHGRRGAQRFLLGSVAEGTVRLAPCAVLVVRSPQATVPKIEPPCPRCLETRRATQGQELWCEQHREQHGRRHTYHFRAAPDAHQSSFLIRT